LKCYTLDESRQHFFRRSLSGRPGAGIRRRAAPLAVPDASAALAQCSLLLEHARAICFPVAFVKRVTHAPFFNAATRFSHWIDGFSPLATEMVFERELIPPWCAPISRQRAQKGAA
jgi:hypothetical protein